MRFWLLFLVAQLGCADHFCSADEGAADRPRKVSVSLQNVEDVLMLPDRDAIVVSRRFPTATAITRIGSLGDEEPLALLPPLAPTDVAPSVTLANGQWWFSRMGFHESAASVFFVSGGATVRQKQRRVDGHGAVIAWLPIRGVEPRGLLISADNEQPALRILEVTPSSTKPIGAFDWWQTASRMTIRHSSRWSAAALPGGHYVVASIDGAPGETTVQMRIAGGATPTDVSVPCNLADRPIDIDVDPAGNLAIVGLSEKNEVVGAVLDVEHPESARCRVLSAPGEVAVTSDYGTPAVLWAGDRFVAAWFRDDGVVRACELTDRRSVPVVVDIGAEADLNRPLRQLVQAGPHTVTFTWRNRDGDVVTRDLPHDLTGHLLGTELRRLMCAALARADQTPADIRAIFPATLRELIRGGRK